MKNKSTRHKDFNTFKFIPFSDRIANLDIDIFHRVGHEYETQYEENQCYFYQTIEKWNVLNLSEGYNTFQKEIHANSCITLPQLLLSKPYVIEVLLKHLHLKNNLCLQPLLELVVAVAKDLQKEFYEYYPQFFEVLIDLLNTKDTEQLEWTFTCLAHLFKLLWRPMVKDINAVFSALLPLLSDNKPEYINRFAAESFAFVARKVKDRKSFLRLLLKTVKNIKDGVSGCGKLFFQVVNGIDRQFHSCAESTLEFLLTALSEEQQSQDLLFEILEHVIANIVTNILPSKSNLLWNVFYKELTKLIEKCTNKNDDNVVKTVDLLLKLMGQCVEYREGKFLQMPVPLIEILLRLLKDCDLSESTLHTITQIGILLLLSKNLKIPQEQASILTRMLLAIPLKSVRLFFIDNVSNYTAFEALILPNFLRYCSTIKLERDCFHILTKLLLRKAPLCKNGIKLLNWKKYSLDFKDDNTEVTRLLLKMIEIEDEKLILDISDYFCSLVCLSHLSINLPDELLNLLDKKVVFFTQQLINRTNMKNQDIKLFLFLLNCTLECLVHVQDYNRLEQHFNQLLETLLSLTINPEYLSSLHILSLCFSALKNNEMVISMKVLQKINIVLEQNFSSPFHEIRLLTCHIYSNFDTLSEFKLRHSTDPDVPSEDWKVFSILYNVESAESHVDTYRDQLQNLEKLTFDKPQMLMCYQTEFKCIPLRYMCGCLFINFQLLWEPILKIISSHALGMDINMFWPIYGNELKKASDNVLNERKTDEGSVEICYEFLRTSFQDYSKIESKPDFVNYRILLWNAMKTFANVAEAKTRDVSDLLLNFIEKEYLKSHSDTVLTYSIKEHSINNCDKGAEYANDKSHPVKKSLLNNKTAIKTLLQMLNVFSQCKSPKSMYREPELYKLYFDLLQDKDSSLQRAALDCMMTYKDKFLTHYKENLYNFIDNKNFKNEISSFRIDKDSDMVLQEHRQNLIPIIMQIVFSKMNVKTGLRTGGKSSGQMRRNVIFRFLAGCHENEMLDFLQKALKLYTRYLNEDPEIMIANIFEDTNLEKFLPPKRLQSTINMMNVIFEQCGGLLGNDGLTFLLKILIVIGALLKVASERVQEIHAGYLAILRTLRTSTIKLVAQFFEHFDRYSWTNKQINAIFQVFIWPYLDKLNTEGIHSPTNLLKLICQWGSNPRYFCLLMKHIEDDENQYILPHVIQLLVNEKSKLTVVNAIEEMLEKLLSLQPDEEDLQLAIPVDNLLSVPGNILKKVGLIDKLNYGSCILLPHIPLLLNKIKRKLNSKSKILNGKELFILSRISELVWEPEISATILDLLLPVVLKKCSSCPEEVASKYCLTIHNLVKNVTKPETHLKEIAPLFGQISYNSSRRILTQTLEVVANTNNEFVLTSSVVAELNAWDKKWIDQPDFERRHNAFKIIQELLDKDEMNLMLGILIIYNCFFLVKNEKDLSLRENAVHTLKQLSVWLIKNHNKHVDYILNETLFPLIRNALKSAKDEVRNESILLLGCLARECPDSHFILRDLNVYTNKTDLEVDFFENLTHLQLHRHARALLKFCQVSKELISSPNPRTLTQFILPLTTHYLCNEKYASKNSVIDAAIEVVATVCRILPWHQYEVMLKYYLDKLSGKIEYQKQLVRLTTGILDAFHFDLSKGNVESVENVHNLMESGREVTKPEVVVANCDTVTVEVQTAEITDIDQAVDDEDDDAIETAEVDDVLEAVVAQLDEEDVSRVQEEVKICEKVVTLCKSTATRVIISIKLVLLPKLQKSLAEMTHYENSHKANRKKTGLEKEEEDLLRVPISLALVKLLQRLPEKILEMNIPSIFMKICTFLKSHLDSVRRVARETLQKIMLALGPSYLSCLLAEMSPLLTRGYQVHVLVFTVHGVLNCLKESYQPTDVDKVLLTVLNLCTADIFGALSEEKEVTKIAVKVSEARHTKTYDTLQILAQYITESCLLDLIFPIKRILETSHSFKNVGKAQDSLRYIAFGLVDNKFVSVESLLKFAYGTASESIPQLMPKPKKIITAQEAELQQRQKEDCLIIPKIAGNRAAFREQNVKVSSMTNAHVLTEFGLRLCYTMLKREKLKDGDYKSFIDPFVAVFKNCLKSKHVKLSTLTLQCLSWVLKYDLPSLRQNIKSITKDIFSILHKYASAGLSKGDNFDLVVAAFKAMAVLVRDAKFHTIDTNQLKVLLLYVEQDVHDHDRQATAFNLLKAIIARKLNVPELHDVMGKVAELSITSELTYVRTQARVVFHQFLMDYPLGNRLEKHLGFYISQMSYELKYGRESAIDMIHTFIGSFPVNVLKQHSGTLLITLGARLVNDEEPECRKMVANCLSLMLQRLPKADYEPLFEIVTVWLKDKNIGHRRLASQLCGIFVNVEKSSFESRLPTLKPIILKQFGLDNAPGKFVKLKKINEAKDSEEHQRVQDHHLFQVLQLLLKLCSNCPSFLKDENLIETLAIHIQTLLGYPHDWIRLAAAQFLGYVLSDTNVARLSELLRSNESDAVGYLFNDPKNAIKSLTLDLCDQLQPSGINNELAEQVIKNLIFVARVLQDVPITTSENENKLNLLWLAKRMRKIVNTEVVENASSTVLRTEIFKWIAGTTTTLDIERIKPILHHLMGPLVRELITTDEKNAPLRQMAKEVCNLIKKKIGLEEYTNTLSKLQQVLSVKRAERKRARTQLAVTDPEMYAKKKIKRHEKKKESRKRKIADRKGSKRIFKKRKVVDIDLDNSEVI